MTVQRPAQRVAGTAAPLLKCFHEALELAGRSAIGRTGGRDGLAIKVAGHGAAGKRAWSVGSGEVGVGDAFGMADRPLDQFDPITVRVGDPAGPRCVRVARVRSRIGRNTLNGKIGEGCIQ